MDVIVTADGSKTLTSATFGETYGSRHGALSEALHVYLRGSGVQRRLAAGLATRVLEVGFGTGLNFLISAAAAQQHGTALRYTALEREPLAAATLAELYRDSALPSGLVGRFIAWVDALGAVAAGRFTLTAGTGAPVVLELVVGEARDFVLGDTALTAGAHAHYDAIYLDAFSPKANSELWTQEFLSGLAQRLEPGGTMVTFSVSGAVRRALTAAGLLVSKAPGPPAGKPQMLIAVRPPLEPPG